MCRQKTGYLRALNPGAAGYSTDYAVSTNKNINTNKQLYFKVGIDFTGIMNQKSQQLEEVHVIILIL